LNLYALSRFYPSRIRSNGILFRSSCFDFESERRWMGVVDQEGSFDKLSEGAYVIDKGGQRMAS
jgi:hypothetical protein